MASSISTAGLRVSYIFSLFFFFFSFFCFNPKSASHLLVKKQKKKGEFPGLLALAETVASGWTLPTERENSHTSKTQGSGLIPRGKMGAGCSFSLFGGMGGLLADKVLTYTYHHSN